VSQDLDEAQRLFKLAADQGNAPATARLAALLRQGSNADLDKSNKLLRKAKKAASAEANDDTKQLAQRMANTYMSNLHCSNEGCTFALSLDLSEDGTKKGQMKVCARCRRAQYCSEKCPYTILRSLSLSCRSLSSPLSAVVFNINSWFSVAWLVLTGQKEHWKAGHKLVCKKPAAQGRRRARSEGQKAEGEGKPSP
jgi:hypothetical protein